MKMLSRAEEMIMLSILKLKDNAYGVAIRELILKETGEEWSFASIYTPLEKLTMKKFVVRKFGEPSTERGGRRKCLYSITKEGLLSLQEVRRVQDSIWSGVLETVVSGGERK